jgi:hypothetical protein
LFPAEHDHRCTNNELIDIKQNSSAEEAHKKQVVLMTLVFVDFIKLV